MRSRGKGKRAAALLALAAFACAGGAAAWRAQAWRVPLTIEVIAPQAEALTAAVVKGERKPSVLLYHTHTWEAY